MTVWRSTTMYYAIGPWEIYCTPIQTPKIGYPWISPHPLPLFAVSRSPPVWRWNGTKTTLDGANYSIG